jgi:hypothetical protein
MRERNAMWNRNGTVAALAAAVAVIGAGCGSETCSGQTPPIESAPSTCTAGPGAQFTVPLEVCPRCDQAMPTCTIDTTNLAQFETIELVPVSEVCDADPSCPLNSCPATGSPPVVNCVVTAPGTAGAYDLVVVKPDGTEFQTSLTVQEGVSGGGCT